MSGERLILRQTEEFRSWFGGLRDRSARIRIAARFARVRAGNLGDAKSVGGGVAEMRFHYGPGYRVYFTRRGSTLVLLLSGGDKGSQPDDIALAKRLAASWDENDGTQDLSLDD